MTERHYSEGSEEIIVLVGVTFPSYQEKEWVSAKNKSKSTIFGIHRIPWTPLLTKKDKAIKDSDPFAIKVWDSSHCKESCLTDLRAR